MPHLFFAGGGLLFGCYCVIIAKWMFSSNGSSALNWLLYLPDAR